MPDVGRLLKIEQGSVTVYTWSKPGALRIVAASKEAMETELILKLIEDLRRIDELEREEGGETRRAFIPFGLAPMLHEAARSRSIVVAEAHGWPSLSLQWSARTNRVSRLLPNEPRNAIRVAGRHVPFARYPVDRLIPLLPIWPGFATNTIFYAAILWLLGLCPFTARRMIRRKRGRCIKCGYDVSHAPHNSCPECGWKQPRRQTSPA